MPDVNIDFETRSTSDLRKCGVYRYVEDPNTDLWCMAYSFDDESDVLLWTPDMPFPEELLERLRDGWYLRAWNAQFERIIWNTVGVGRYGFPEMPRMKFICTQADALAMGLPAKLDSAARALRLDMEKDAEGHALMMRMARPRKKSPLIWWSVPERMQRLYEYCKQDVRVERGIKRRTRRLSDAERGAYLFDQRINDRGVRLDVHLVKQARALAYEGIKHANQVIATATDGDVEAVTQVAKMQHWLAEQGCDIPDLKATTLQEYLQREDELHPAVRDVLIARSEAGKASIKKLDKMLEVVCKDGRLHGLLQYHGAGTGRWAGRLVQPQNFPRGSVKNVEQYIEHVINGVPYDVIDIYANPLEIVSSMLRSMLVASDSDHTLMAADFSAIEARVLAWFAGQKDLLKQFEDHDRGIGKEVYMIVAEELSTSRQHGKTVILGSGYGMGWSKFQLLARTAYGIELTDEQAQFFIKWYRGKYKKIVEFWRALEKAVLRAVDNPGTVVVMDGHQNITWTVRGGHLWCILPSKRPLCYIHPMVREKKAPWGQIQRVVTVETQDQFTHKWIRRDLYGGLLAENIVQAASRDLLLASMQYVEAHGYPVILTVHDEVVVDAPQNDLMGKPLTYERFIDLMSTVPAWAAGCPVKATGWAGHRYRKG